MKKLAQIIFIAMVAYASTTAFAQSGTQELHREIEQIQAETDRLRIWSESQKAADRAREIAEQAASAQADAAKKAEEATEELRNEMEQAAVRTKNNIYLMVLLIFTAGFIAYIIRKSKREEIMQENQKFGIVAIIGSTLIILLAVMIYDGWMYSVDFLQNLMSSLQIRLFKDEGWHDAYFIDVPTKYVALACICAAAYGLTTYLGITSAPKLKTQKTDTPGSDRTP